MDVLTLIAIIIVCGTVVAVARKMDVSIHHHHHVYTDQVPQQHTAVDPLTKEELDASRINNIDAAAAAIQSAVFDILREEDRNGTV